MSAITSIEYKNHTIQINLYTGKCHTCIDQESITTASLRNVKELIDAFEREQTASLLLNTSIND